MIYYICHACKERIKDKSQLQIRLGYSWHHQCLEKCKMNWSSDVTQLKIKQKHEIAELQAENLALYVKLAAAGGRARENARLKTELARKTVERDMSIAMAITSQMNKETCEWVLDSDYEMGDTYESSCEQSWSFVDGGPEDNLVNFCHFCGKPVVVKGKKE